MSSKFSGVLVKESENKSFERKENDYIKTKQFFPINVPVEVRIVDAHPSRQFFQGGQPLCRSFDADFVMTKLTGTENPDGPGTVFVFEQGETLELPDEKLFYAEQRSMMFKSFVKILHTVLLLLSSSV